MLAGVERQQRGGGSTERTKQEATRQTKTQNQQREPHEELASLADSRFEGTARRSLPDLMQRRIHVSGRRWVASKMGRKVIEEGWRAKQSERSDVDEGEGFVGNVERRGEEVKEKLAKGIGTGQKVN